MRTAQDFILEIPVLKPGDQITKARQILRDDRFREVYVVDAKKNLLGYIDITDGLRVTATKSNVTIEGFVKEAPMVHPADSIEDGGTGNAELPHRQCRGGGPGTPHQREASSSRTSSR